MNKPSISSYLDKLTLLERRTGTHTSYDLLDPIVPVTSDIVSIQTFAKTIAQFIGLHDYIFIVSFAQQDENVGGHIELRSSGQEVFIEVSDKAIPFPEAVAATLCHELTHKWLARHGIRFDIEIENEILTDIATVYLGLGKLMLNGCNNERTDVERNSNGTTTNTYTYKCGYLNHEQLAVVYSLICLVRGIPKKLKEQGLNNESISALRYCNSVYRHLFSELLDHGKGPDAYNACLANSVRDWQKQLVHLHKLNLYVEGACCGTVREKLSDAHKIISSLSDEIQKIDDLSTPDPVLRNLEFLAHIENVMEYDNDLKYAVGRMESHKRHLKWFAAYFQKFNKDFPPPKSSMFNLISCHQCGTQLKLPENKGDMVVTCKNCEYRFVFSTHPLSKNGSSLSGKFSLKSWISRRLRKEERATHVEF